MEKNPQGRIQSLDRAFSLIEIIANSPDPLTLKKITELADLPKPTVYRILTSLETWGYVEQDKYNNYKLGTKFLILGSKVQDSLEIRKIARPFLKELNNETKETIFLGVIDKGRSLYVDKLDGHHSVRLVSRIGSRNHLHSTSLGKCLLSGLTEAEIREIISQQGMPALTANTITDLDRLMDQIKLVREKGYAMDDMENEEGVRCVASPVKNHKGKVIAAISISGPAQRITDETIDAKLRPALLSSANKVSQALGYIDGQ
ncbi:MAG: IclR family transcriptional regulator [Bacillota bacterium]